MGGIMMSIAWEHNPQGEFHGYGTIHWGHWFLLGFLWFIPTCVVATLLYACFAVGTVFVISRGRRGFSYLCEESQHQEHEKKRKLDGI